MAERLHRQLKDSIRSHQNNEWVLILPTILLGIRSVIKEDLKVTLAELTYGYNIQLLGEFLTPSNTTDKV